MMPLNPYEYTETPKPDISPDNDGDFPPTPFTLKLARRGRSCLMTVEQDHLVIEGESLCEPIRIQRHERYRLNSCFYYAGKELIVWHRPTRKEFTFRIEEQGMADLKISWLFAWKEGVPDNRTPEEHVKKTSNKWLYKAPISWLLFNTVLFGFFVSAFYNRGVVLPVWQSIVLSVFSIASLAAFVLMFIRIKEGILLTALILFSFYLICMTSTDVFLFIRSNVFLLVILCLATWKTCVMSYVRATRLQRQIRENQTEY